jgi:hypothetical protein
MVLTPRPCRIGFDPHLRAQAGMIVCEHKLAAMKLRDGRDQT